MQIIEKNYIVNGSLARLVDETLVEQGAEVIPTMTRGMQVQVRLNLYRDSDTPYTLAELGFPHWDFVLGHDYDTDPERSPVQVRASSVNVEASGDTDPRAVVVIELTETNTEELVAQLGSNEFKTFHGELVGMETVNGSPEFLIQFDVKVQNRVGAGGTLSPTPLPYSGYPDLPDETGIFQLEIAEDTERGGLVPSWVEGGAGSDRIYIIDTFGTYVLPTDYRHVLLYNTTSGGGGVTLDIRDCTDAMKPGETLVIDMRSYTFPRRASYTLLTRASGADYTTELACPMLLIKLADSTFKSIYHTPVWGVNGKASVDGGITLTASDVGAAATSHTHPIAQITSLQTNLNMLQSQITSLQSALSQKVNPAPSDGKLYGMKDGEWVEISEVSADSMLMDGADQLVDNNDTLTDN